MIRGRELERMIGFCAMMVAALAMIVFLALCVVHAGEGTNGGILALIVLFSVAETLLFNVGTDLWLGR